MSISLWDCRALTHECKQHYSKFPDLSFNLFLLSFCALSVKCNNSYIVCKMTRHCAGTVQMREKSESGIRKWEEMWFKTTAEDGEGSAVTCDGRLFNKRAAATGNTLSPTVDRRVRQMSRDVDEAERSHHLAWVYPLRQQLMDWHNELFEQYFLLVECHSFHNTTPSKHWKTDDSHICGLIFIKLIWQQTVG